MAGDGGPVRGKDQDPDGKRGLDASKVSHGKGKSFERSDRRRGRPAYLRSPDDTPLRDANRDFMLGVLTARAAKTLVIYLEGTNAYASQWLLRFLEQHPITLSGTWEDISGDTFLRQLISTPAEESPSPAAAPADASAAPAAASSSSGQQPAGGRAAAAGAPLMVAGQKQKQRPEQQGQVARKGDDTECEFGWDAELEECSRDVGALLVDPRGLAESILEVRCRLAKEFIADLGLVPEDNNELLRQSLTASLESSLKGVAASPDGEVGVGPEPNP
ncbi:hypothetical protein FOA52_011415 [Chlamydomonas sp. UWO 241]|nr:hypothetical protein FOA52_011415 [Chlamydomonas sp. UWO 241]